MNSALFTTVLLLAVTRLCHGQECGQCHSYGIDFLPQQSYFQNIDSTEPFTALQEFEGCSNDTANNNFVDSNGDQFECNLSQLAPDDTPQLVTCPVDKNELLDGEYSLLIISNNGDCEPIAHQRDFTLSVGQQQTETVSPTISMSTTSTPIVTVLQIVTQTISQTATPSTLTVPKATLKPTVTIYPLPKVTVVTRAIFTLTKIQQVASVISTKTVTRSPKCAPTRKRRIADPEARIAATVPAAASLDQRDALPVPTAHSGTTEFKRAILEGRKVGQKIKEHFVRERRERLSLNKRAPDEPIITITDSDGEPVTSMAIITAPTMTVTGQTIIPSTYITTPTITVSKGYYVQITTVTAPQKTITLTQWKQLTTTRITKTQDVVLTVTTTTTPIGASASCAMNGGTLA